MYISRGSILKENFSKIRKKIPKKIKKMPDNIKILPIPPILDDTQEYILWLPLFFYLLVVFL